MTPDDDDDDNDDDDVDDDDDDDDEDRISKPNTIDGSNPLQGLPGQAGRGRADDVKLNCTLSHLCSLATLAFLLRCDVRYGFRDASNPLTASSMYLLLY